MAQSQQIGRSPPKRFVRRGRWILYWTQAGTFAQMLPMLPGSFPNQQLLQSPLQQPHQQQPTADDNSMQLLAQQVANNTAVMQEGLASFKQMNEGIGKLNKTLLEMNSDMKQRDTVAQANYQESQANFQGLQLASQRNYQELQENFQCLQSSTKTDYQELQQNYQALLRSSQTNYQELRSNFQGLQQASNTNYADIHAHYQNLVRMFSEYNDQSSDEPRKLRRTNHPESSGISDTDVLEQAKVLKKQLKQKNDIKNYCLRFINQTTTDQLELPWVKFDDSPSVAISGQYLYDFLLGGVDVTDDMAVAIIRVSRKHEVSREADHRGRCHHVTHKWAEMVLSGSARGTPILRAFQEPGLPYMLNHCNLLNIALKLDEGWASLHVDLVKRETLLIHPALSETPEAIVMGKYEGPCKVLTAVAICHMNQISSQTHTPQGWVYRVALREKQPRYGLNIGTLATYYSTPRANQFETVDKETIRHTKRAIVHSLTKLCAVVTRMSVPPPAPRGARTHSGGSRDGYGQFIKTHDYIEFDEGNDQFVDPTPQIILK